MTLQEVERDLKVISPHFRVVQHPVNKDMSGIYFMDRFLFSMPGGEVLRKRDPMYKNEMGLVHRSYEEVIAMATNYVKRLSSDPEFRASEEAPIV